jgi:hypothetical protein
VNSPGRFFVMYAADGGIGVTPPSTKGKPVERGLMAKKLKTYQTSLGFYDLALAAPSMKAEP